MSDASELLVQQISRLRRYARALTGDANRADDLVQDCLERAWGRIHLWREGSDMRAWCFTIMHNVFANNARHHSRQPSLVEYSDTNDSRVPPNHDQTLEIRELQAAIDVLPAQYREVVLLVGMEQMRYEEAADVLGIPVGTVMSRLSRGRKKLRELIQEGEPGQVHLRRVK